MNLGEFLAENGTMLAANVKLIEHEGIKWLKFEEIIPDAMTPVKSLSRGAMFSNHPRKDEPDFYSPCDSKTCDEGKYKLRNGDFNICYRCQGKNYITETKQKANHIYDLSPSGMLKVQNGEIISFD